MIRCCGVSTACMARWHLSEFLSEKGKNLKGGESVDQKEQDTFLECERHRVFLLLMMAGGFYGAYTYTARGGGCGGTGNARKGCRYAGESRGGGSASSACARGVFEERQHGVYGLL